MSAFSQYFCVLNTPLTQLLFDLWAKIKTNCQMVGVIRGEVRGWSGSTAGQSEGFFVRMGYMLATAALYSSRILKSFVTRPQVLNSADLTCFILTPVVFGCLRAGLIILRLYSTKNRCLILPLEWLYVSKILMIHIWLCFLWFSLLAFTRIAKCRSLWVVRPARRQVIRSS